MTDHNTPIFTPLVVTAMVSVLAFSGIGVAAITGHLSITTHSRLNPFASFNNTAASGIIQAPVLQSVAHVGLTRHRGETFSEGKPVDYKFGARVPSRKKAVCPDCGVVDSITSGQSKPVAAGTAPSISMGSEGATILKVSGQADEQARSGRSGFVVTVHMENGTVRTIYESERPSFNIGERIKLVNGAVIRIG